MEPQDVNYPKEVIMEKIEQQAKKPEEIEVYYVEFEEKRIDGLIRKIIKKIMGDRRN